MSFPYREIEKKIGYVFIDKNLLKTAFTHASYAHRYGGENNERLEYLGDSVLQLIVTEWQYLGDEKADEGKLTARRQKLVCKNALDTATDGLGVFEYLLIDGNENNIKGKAKSSLFEALLAAIYLDGGYKKAKAFVIKHGNLHSDILQENPKGELKEYLEKRGYDSPVYQVDKRGKDNSPIFTATVTALGETATGEGRTKKEAEATSASRLLWELKRKEKR